MKKDGLFMDKELTVILQCIEHLALISQSINNNNNSIKIKTK